MWYYMCMDEQTLVTKRESIKSAFDEQTKIETEAKSEQLRLQGEYRLINELIDQLQQVSKDRKSKK